MLDFSDFAQRMGSVLMEGSNISAFVRTLFEAIIPEDRYDLLNKSQRSFSSYYSGKTSINALARKINVCVQTKSFERFLKKSGSTSVKKLCGAFSDVLPKIDASNAGRILAELFDQIITEAAATKKGQSKKSQTEAAEQADKNVNSAMHGFHITTSRTVNITHPIQQLERSVEELFCDYMKKATDYFSMKKTLLYEQQPRSFYELYVCNNLSYYKNEARITNGRGSKNKITISDATPQILNKEAKHIIIAGTGGIGKSMLLTHLFLSSAKEYSETSKLPVFAALKDYQSKTSSIVDFILKAVKAFTPEISKQDITDKLKSGKVLLMLDGLDELQSALYEKFISDLEDFIKAYPDDSIIVTSRPTNSFISYSMFSVFGIDPLTKSQAIQLITKLNYWNKQAKSDFLKELDRSLYKTHKEFASNPLLLTIMLMTYITFGEVPAKMHVFYDKAYETMARLHDALTNVLFKRNLRQRNYLNSSRNFVHVRIVKRRLSSRAKSLHCSWTRSSTRILSQR